MKREIIRPSTQKRKARYSDNILQVIVLTAFGCNFAPSGSHSLLLTSKKSSKPPRAGGAAFSSAKLNCRNPSPNSTTPTLHVFFFWARLASFARSCARCTAAPTNLEEVLAVTRGPRTVPSYRAFSVLTRLRVGWLVFTVVDPLPLATVIGFPALERW